MKRWSGLPSKWRTATFDPVMVGIWSVGLAIRLIFLPVTFHSDLYQVYSRAALAVTSGDWFAWNSQLVAQLVHTAWFAFVRLLLPASGDLWSPTAGVAGLGAQPADIERFLAYRYLARALVLLKLPYLLGDALTGWLLLRLAPGGPRRWLLALWWLNPIVIYTSALFGRHETIWIALLVAGCLAASRQRRWLGFLLSALAAVARFFPAFVLPFYIVSLRRSWRQVLLVLGATTTVWSLIDLFFVVRSGRSPTLTLLGDYPHVRYLVALAVPVGDDTPLALFPLLYVLALCYWIARAPLGVDAYRAIAGALLCTVVALIPVHPQYVVWAIPFAVPVLARNGSGRVIAGLQAGLFVLWLLRWGASVTTELFLPLGQSFVATLPDPQLVAAALIPPAVWQPVVRAAFTGVTLWIGWLVLEEGVLDPSARRERQGELVGGRR
ncbi:hypothetical protein OO015_07960 [Thermomicrobium sp. 4228-Ro]|uniref:hypothetical protein n=1 Tax=Thermomicrobium sp. 4228-Ro TaxID=2993937 RepID=UPI0022494765|nr:hypothetical protein [Thermomicrobium sp. 4228-Ro]MCX2727428.1 hypothetical protein [Thermomicrobium sp. 4228-Ro]